MKKYIFNMFLLLFFIHSNGYALETNEHLASNEFKEFCEKKLKPNRIHFKIIDNGYKTDYTKNYKQLKTLRSKDNLISDFSNVIGLVSYKFNGKGIVKLKAYSDKKDDLACMTFDLNIEMSLDHTLFVASDFLDNSCVFKEIYNHEMQHIKANEDQLSKVRFYLQDLADQAYRKQIFYGEKDSLVEQIKAEAKNKWLKVAQQKQREVFWAHKKIDSREAYAYTNQMCDGYVARYMKKQNANRN